MVSLLPQFVTVTTSTTNGVTITTTIDTIRVSSVQIDFNSNYICATVQRGTVVASQFVSNEVDLSICAYGDGSFTSTDGSWKGAAGSLNMSALLTSYGAAFDGALTAGLAAIVAGAQGTTGIQGTTGAQGITGTTGTQATTS
jgi:hypothetical protein